MKCRRIAAIMSLTLSCVACKHSANYTFATRDNVEPGVWTESSSVIIEQDTLHATI